MFLWVTSISVMWKVRGLLFRSSKGCCFIRLLKELLVDEDGTVDLLNWMLRSEENILL